MFAVGAVATVLLAPGCVLIGIATLFSPAAAGSSSCLWDAQATDSLGVSRPVPASLSATNANGEMVSLKAQEITTVPLAEACGALKTVPINSDLVLAARSLGISFGDE